MERWHASIGDELNHIDSIINDAFLLSNTELSEMCSYVVSSGGKRIRPAICVLANRVCKGTGDKVLDAAAAIEIIHNATLIHDDINDNSELRRGRKTLHKEFTVSKAIIAGDIMFAIGFKLMGSSSGDVIRTVVTATESVADSEFIQKDFEHISNVDESNYMDIIRGKTAMPICMAAKVGALIADGDSKCVDAVSKYSMSVGLAFQIIDDILDVEGDPSNTGKAVGTDIMEGKPTLPLIIAMGDAKYGKRLKELFVKTSISDSEISEALDLIKKTDAIEQCRQKAEALAKDAINALSSVPQSKYKDSMIGLSNYVVRRNR